MNQKVFKKKRVGTTLVEVAIVIIIIAAIGYMATSKGGDSVLKSQQAKTKNDLTALCTAHTIYYLNESNTVATDAQLMASTKNYFNAGDVWDGTNMVDAFGNAYTTATAAGITTRGLSAATQAALGGVNYTCTYP